MEVVVKRWELVETGDKIRGLFKDVYGFIDWLFSPRLAYEQASRKTLQLGAFKYCRDDIHEKVDLLIKNYRLLSAQIDVSLLLLNL